MTGALAQAKEMAKAKKGTQDILPAAERDANLAKMRESSKVPQRLYHGTTDDIQKFDPSKAGKKTKNLTTALGTFLSDNPKEASRFAEQWGTEGGNVMPVFAQIQNPYQMPYKEFDELAMGAWNRMMKDPSYDPNAVVKWNDIEGAKRAAAAVNKHEPDALQDVINRRNELMAQGHDAVIVDIGGNKEVIVFDPAKIKSATGNRGTYDIEDADITKADGGPIRMQPKKPKDSAQGFMDKLQQAAQDAQKIPTSPLGFLLNTGYAGYKHFTGKDPLADLQRELDRKLNPKLDTGSEPVQQFEKLAAGGEVKHMADAGKVTKGIVGALTKATEMAKAEKAVPKVDRLSMSYKDVTKRVPELTEAANLLARGKITASQYDAMVARLKPVTPYSFVPAPATIEDAMKALTENKKPMFGKSKDMTAGEQADLRLDIPAYKDHGVWVNSIHRKDQPTVYGSTSSVKNATMIGSPDKALKVAQGGPKAPFAVIRGDWNPMSEEAAVAKAQEYLDHPEWKQVGYDPERHGYFYDRASMEPVHGAEEVIQIGPLVLAKKPTYGKKSEEKYSHGGVLHMADAGRVSRGVTGALTKAKEMAQAKKAASADKPGVQYADPLKPADMRMSEALGNAGAEGKTLNFTETDRSRVKGQNRGGVGFAGLQHYSRPHKKANTVWGFGNTNTAEKKIRQNDPENSLWTTFIGSPQQHKSNSVVIGDAMKEFQNSVKQGVVPREQIMLMNKRLNELTDPKTGAKVFENGFDLTDPAALNVANTFSRRAAVGDVMLGLGVKGPMTRLDFKKEFPNTKFTDGSNIENILKRETDPDLVDAGTYDVGNRLFVMDGKIIQRPDLNEAFPEQVTGTDLGMKYKLVPPEKAMRDFYKAREGRKDKNDKPSPVNYYDLARAEPSQLVDEDYLTFLQKEGYKKGGTVTSEESPADMARFQKRFAMHKALGGRVNKQPAKMAEGGRASIFDAPVKRMSKGGSSDEPTTREIAEALGELAVTQGKEEFQSFKKPRAATDIGNRGILAPALGLPVGMINMGLGGVDALTGMMGKPTRLSSEKPFAGSEHIKDLMNKYGVTSGEDRPMTEMALSLFSPTGMIKGAQGMTKGAVKAAGAMRKPMSGLNAMREKTN
jgi:hypothetical protein